MIEGEVDPPEIANTRGGRGSLSSEIRSTDLKRDTFDDEYRSRSVSEKVTHDLTSFLSRFLHQNTVLQTELLESRMEDEQYKSRARSLERDLAEMISMCEHQKIESNNRIQYLEKQLYEVSTEVAQRNNVQSLPPPNEHELYKTISSLQTKLTESEHERLDLKSRLHSLQPLLRSAISERSALVHQLEMEHKAWTTAQGEYEEKVRRLTAKCDRLEERNRALERGRDEGDNGPASTEEVEELRAKLSEAMLVLEASQSRAIDLEQQVGLLEEHATVAMGVRQSDKKRITHLQSTLDSLEEKRYIQIQNAANKIEELATAVNQLEFMRSAAADRATSMESKCLELSQKLVAQTDTNVDVIHALVSLSKIMDVLESLLARQEAQSNKLGGLDLETKRERISMELKLEEANRLQRDLEEKLEAQAKEVFLLQQQLVAQAEGMEGERGDVAAARGEAERLGREAAELRKCIEEKERMMEASEGEKTALREQLEDVEKRMGVEARQMREEREAAESRVRSLEIETEKRVRGLEGEIMDRVLEVKRLESERDQIELKLNRERDEVARISDTFNAYKLSQSETTLEIRETHLRERSNLERALADLKAHSQKISNEAEEKLRNVVSQLEAAQRENIQLTHTSDTKTDRYEELVRQLRADLQAAKGSKAELEGEMRAIVETNRSLEDDRMKLRREIGERQNENFEFERKFKVTNDQLRSLREEFALATKLREKEERQLAKLKKEHSEIVDRLKAQVDAGEEVKLAAEERAMHLIDERETTASKLDQLKLALEEAREREKRAEGQLARTIERCDGKLSEAAEEWDRERKKFLSESVRLHLNIEELEDQIRVLHRINVEHHFRGVESALDNELAKLDRMKEMSDGESGGGEEQGRSRGSTRTKSGGLIDVESDCWL